MSDLYKESADISRLNNKITAQTEKIELLRAQVAALREALELLHDNIVTAFPSLANLGPVAAARAALEEK